MWAGESGVGYNIEPPAHLATVLYICKVINVRVHPSR
jgi:hypothetical protein